MISFKELLNQIKSENIIPFSFNFSGKPASLKLLNTSENTNGKYKKLKIAYKLQEADLMVYLIINTFGTDDVMEFSFMLSAKKNIDNLISNVKIADLAIDSKKQAIKFYGSTGGFWDLDRKFPPKSLKFYEKELAVGKSYKLDSDFTARSSNSQLPLWLIAEESEGLWLAPQWSGMWEFVVINKETKILVSYGIPSLSFKMYQSEEKKLPLFSLGRYSGNEEDGFNALRRAIRTYYTPNINGKKPIPLVKWNNIQGHPSWHTEENLYREVDKASEVGCEAFILDANWNSSPFDNRRWFIKALENWEYSKERFPQGIEKFADYVHKKNMRYGFWFEPRLVKHSPIVKQFSDIFLEPDWNKINSPNFGKSVGELECDCFANHYLLDLSKKNAQEWLLEVMEKFILEYKADWLWYDFNTHPRPIYWDYHEEEDRKGLMELGFYQGLYKVLDIIHKKYPNVWINTTASGGRCIDLAMIRSSHSIWVDDEPYFDDIRRNFISSLNRFLPSNFIESSLFIADEAKKELFVPEGVKKPICGNEHFLTQFGGVFQLGQGLIFFSENELKDTAYYISKYKAYRSYIEKDYYELFPFPQSDDVWDGWQFHDPDTDSGIVVLFRLNNSKELSKKVKLKKLDENKLYNYSFLAGGAEMKGNKNTIDITFNTDNDKAALIFYK